MASGGTSRLGEPVNSWRGRPILYSGSPIISLSCAIQPTVRASAKIAVNRLTGMPIAGAGMLLNLAAILSNGGHMPALPGAMRHAGLSYTGVHNNSVAEAHPNLAWFVDRWAAPSWIPAGNVFSVGDVLIAVGAIVLITAAMGARLPFRRPGVPAVDGDGRA